MATQVSELHEDVFGFPSSPDQLAVFSPPTSEYDYEYDELAERHLQGGFLKNHENFAQNSRGLKRKQSYSVVPVVEAPRKRFAPEVNGLGNVSLLNGNNGITLSVQTPLSSSRVKSTTPDIDLLFSLFKVLEEEAGEWNSSAPSSSVSSPVSGFEQYPVYVESPSESFDSSSPASSPAAYVPDCDDRFQTQIQIQPQTQDQMFQFQLHLLQLQQLQQFQACGSVVPEVYPTQPAFETVGLLGFADQLN